MSTADSYFETHPTAILERISDAFLVLDVRWHVTSLNEEAAAFFGRSRKELLGRSLWQELPEIVGKAFYLACHQAVREQASFYWNEYFPDQQRRLDLRFYPSADGLNVVTQDVTEAHAVRRRLEEREQRYRSLFDQNIDAVFTFDLESRFVDVNAACETVSGYTGEELKGKPFLPLVVPEDQERTVTITRRAMNGTSQQEEIAIFHKSGRRVSLHITKVPIFVDGQIVGLYGIAKDITPQKQAEAALRESEAWMRTIAESSPVAMMITRWQDSRILYANRHFHDLVGLAPQAEILGEPAVQFYALPTEREILRRLLTDTALVQNWESRLRRVDGTTCWVSGGFQRMVYRGEDAIFAVHHDMTDQKQLLEDAYAEAERDSLTGLLNHRAFHRRLEEEAARAQQQGTSLGVAVLDLDNFKFFNDAYGHAVGDDVLRQVAAVLQGACRPGDTLARFGGDEFALLLPGLGKEGSAETVASRLAANLNDVSYHPPGYGCAIPVSLSLGVALFPSEAPTRLAVMQIADERLLRAKTGAFTDAEAQRMRGVMRHAIEGFSMLDALVSAVDNKDRYTRHHSEDVMTYSLQIAHGLGWDEGSRQNVAAAALLHDVGKIGVSDQILRKPGRLTDEEFEAVKMHPSIGAVIVAAVPGLESTVDAVRLHHERWDGRGYPNGLRGPETPLIARIMAVADAYSAMTTDRPYRKGMSSNEAQRILAQGAGGQWDPDCVQAFLESQNARSVN